MSSGGGGGGKKKPGAKKKTPVPTGPFYGGRHARGGPVWPGMAYMVGERGPEMFVSGTPGNIVPMGGGPTVVDVYLDGRKIARAVSPHLHRSSKQANSQGRGRLPGVKPAY